MSSIKWNKVVDTLPDDCSKVIAWSPNGENHPPNLMQETIFIGGEFIYGYYNNTMRGVTHWTYLPDPPYD